MPSKRGTLTPKERAYVAKAAQVGEGEAAAHMAGYKFPAQAAQQLAQRPAVVSEVKRLQSERLNNDLLPLAVDRIEKILKSDKANPRDHIAAAKLVFDNTIKAGDGANEKEPHEMTADELAERISRLRQEQDAIANGAKDVTPEQDENKGDAFG